MQTRQLGRSQIQSADAAGISERTGRDLDHGGRAVRGPRTYRTRVDPFASVWLSVIEPLLLRDAQLQAVTLLGELQRLFPGQFVVGQLRTLGRRLRQWRAVAGPERVVIFPQVHPPGWQALLDFTVCNELLVTIGGVAFAHRLGHVCFASSGWQFAQVIQGGESYPALAETVRLAFEAFGGVPETLRTDSLSAAYKNMSQQEDLTVRFAALCHHYGCSATRNTLGVAHENGAVESPNGHLKQRIDQALRLRGSRDFASLDDYRALVSAVVATANATRSDAIAVERAAVKPLPRFAGVTWTEALGTVSRFGMIIVLGRYYMVPSRLIGHRLVVRLYDDRLEFFAADTFVHGCPRLHGERRERAINYHYCIESLVKKPGAFARLIYRDELHPNRVFAATWERLRERLGESAACRTYVRILYLAHRHACENALSARLEALLSSDDLPIIDDLRRELTAPAPAAFAQMTFRTADPAGYDLLRTISDSLPPQVATA